MPQIVLVHIHHHDAFEFTGVIDRGDKAHDFFLRQVILINTGNDGAAGKNIIDIVLVNSQRAFLQKRSMIHRELIRVNQVVEIDIVII